MLELNLSFQQINNIACSLGETPIYDEQQDVLYYVDINQSQVYCYSLAQQSTSSFVVPKFTSACLLTQDPQKLLLVAQSGLYVLDLETKQYQLLDDLSELHLSERKLRPNECQVLSDGLYLSFMHLEVEKETGALYKYAGQGSLKLIQDKLTIPNTLVEDAEAIYFADSATAQFYRLDKNTEELSLMHHQFASGSICDGSCMLEHNLILNADWGKQILRVIRINQQNLEELIHIKVPCQQASSVALGGKSLDKLFVTSASTSLAVDTLNSYDGKTLYLDLAELMQCNSDEQNQAINQAINQVLKPALANSSSSNKSFSSTPYLLKGRLAHRFNLEQYF